MTNEIRRRFLIGALLAWVPWTPIAIGLRELFRRASSTKATGVAVLVAELGEAFALWGIIAMVIAQITAIVWLAKSFSPENWLRNLVSVVSIALSGLMLVLVCLFILAIRFWVYR